MSVYQDEIDLRPYIFALIKAWRFIAILVVLMAALGFIFTLRQPEVYETTATILLTRTRSNLALAEQFLTVNEPVDSRFRMDALLAIANSNAIASESIERLGENLPETERTLSKMKGHIRVTSKGDAILITGIAGRPEVAADIANAWAEETVETINEAYSGDQHLVELETKLAAAQGEYETAQAALETFRAESQVPVLQVQLREAQNFVSQRLQAVNQLVAYYEQRRQAMIELQDQAMALQAQIEQNPQSDAAQWGDALAVLHLRATAFAFNPEPPAQAIDKEGATQVIVSSGSPMEIQIADLSALAGSAQNLSRDLASIIKQAQAEQASAEENITRLTEDLAETDGSLGGVTSYLQRIEAELENQHARELELEGQRDVTFSALQALMQKQVELRNAIQNLNQVSLAAPAVSPETPTNNSLIRNTLIAAAIGLILGVLWALLTAWWRDAGLSPARATSAPENR